MSLATLPLPSITLVLTSELLYVPTRVAIFDDDQDLFSKPPPDSGLDTDQQNNEVSPEHQDSTHSLKEGSKWLRVFRRRRGPESLGSSIVSTSFFPSIVRRLFGPSLLRHAAQS